MVDGVVVGTGERLGTLEQAYGFIRLAERGLDARPAVEARCTAGLIALQRLVQALGLGQVLGVLEEDEGELRLVYRALGKLLGESD